MVPFPAVTICHDIDFWKWTGILSAMATNDKDNAIGNTDLYIYEGYSNLELDFSNAIGHTRIGPES